MSNRSRAPKLTSAQEIAAAKQRQLDLMKSGNVKDPEQPLGFVVLARRPKPGGAYNYEILTMRDGTPIAIAPGTDDGLRRAQNVLESRTDPRFKSMRPPADPLDPVEYVIGEISERTP